MAFDPAAVRRDLPYLDRRLYLNTASTGISHRLAGKATARFFDEMYARGYDGAADWRAVAGRVRAQVGRLANVAPDDVGFAGTTTEALNLIAHSLPVRPGDRVAHLADEFPSVRAAADILVTRGAERIEPAVEGEEGRSRALAQAAAGANFVLVSHVHWESGTKIDLATLSAACRAAGALLIVDGIQALAATEADARSQTPMSPRCSMADLGLRARGRHHRPPPARAPDAGVPRLCQPAAVARSPTATPTIPA